MDWTVAAVAFQAALFVYFELHEWVSLPPWNDMSPGNPERRVAVVLGAAQLVVIVGFSQEWLWLMGPGIAMYIAWLWLQIAGWWKPYLFGTTERHMKAYEKYFGRTYKFLPPIGDHPIPNAAHVGLQLLLIAVIVSAVGAFVAAA